ncbi:MAG TPA: O-antigen ligase family protein [Stellaceae bacterium]|nr:O-antigen ligase family protein [Stellaceae bacterium]
MAAAATRDAGAGAFTLNGLLTLVLLAPLPLGLVYPLGWWTLSGSVAVLLLAFGAAAWRQPLAAQRLGAMATWLLPFAATAMWIVLQAAPVTPVAWHHPLWQAAREVLGADVRGAVSLNPFDTVSALIRLLAYGGIFWLALHLGRSAERARGVFLALSVAGFLYAGYGFLVEVSGAKLVLWYPQIWYPDSVTATFINRNNYATYAGLGLIAASGLVIRHLSMVLSLPLDGRARLLRFAQSMSLGRSLFLGGWMVLVTALVLSNSRGGVVSALLGLTALVVAASALRMLRARDALAMAGVIAVAGALLITAAGEQLGVRFATTALEREGRPIAYELILEGIGERPWLGTGFGTFEEAFALVRDERLSGGWDKAHNTYLENAFELGIPAAALLTAACLAMLWRCVVGLRARRRAGIYPAIGIGATVLVGCHSLVDFGLQIPAIAATYALVMGVAVAQSWPSAALLTAAPSARRKHRAVAALSLTLGALLLVLSVPRLASELWLLPGTRALEQSERNRAASETEIAALIGSRDSGLAVLDAPRSHFEIGFGLQRLAEREVGAGPRYHALLDAAAQSFRRGLARAPANPFAWTALARGALEEGAPQRTLKPLIELAMASAPAAATLALARLELCLMEEPLPNAADVPLRDLQVRLAWRQSPHRLVALARASRREALVRAALAVPDAAEFDRLLHELR